MNAGDEHTTSLKRTTHLLMQDKTGRDTGPACGGKVVDVFPEHLTVSEGCSHHKSCQKIVERYLVVRDARHATPYRTRFGARFQIACRLAVDLTALE